MAFFDRFRKNKSTNIVDEDLEVIKREREVNRARRDADRAMVELEAMVVEHEAELRKAQGTYDASVREAEDFVSDMEERVSSLNNRRTYADEVVRDQARRTLADMAVRKAKNSRLGILLDYVRGNEARESLGLSSNSKPSGTYDSILDKYMYQELDNNCVGNVFAFFITNSREKTFPTKKEMVFIPFLAGLEEEGVSLNDLGVPGGVKDIYLKCKEDGHGEIKQAPGYVLGLSMGFLMGVYDYDEYTSKCNSNEDMRRIVLAHRIEEQVRVDGTFSDSLPAEWLVNVVDINEKKSGNLKSSRL